MHCKLDSTTQSGMIVIQDADLEYDPSDWTPMFRLYERKKIRWHDGIKALWYVMKFRLVRA
jgi:hypothetical protein